VNIKETDMCKAYYLYCSHRREDRMIEYKTFVVKPEVRCTLGRPGYRYKDDIVMDRKEIA
jgi:hypothetical protein